MNEAVNVCDFINEAKPEQMSIVLHGAHTDTDTHTYTEEKERGTPLNRQKRTNNRVHNVINSMRNPKMAQALRHKLKTYIKCVHLFRNDRVPHCCNLRKK